MWILYHTLHVLHIVVHHALECSHPCSIGINLASAELLKRDAKIAIDYVFVFLVDLTQKRLVIVLGVEFWRYHVKRDKTFLADSILMIRKVEFEHSWLIQEVQFSRKRFLLPSVQFLIYEETFLHIFAHMAYFRHRVFVHSVKEQTNLIFASLIDHWP